jgi:TatD DNase family protein
MSWTDSHCHVSYDGVGIDAVARAHASGVTRVVSVGTDVAKSAATIGDARLCRAAGFPVWATAGLHPHDATDGLDGLEALLGEPEVVAVGECGLDYYYEHSPREVQLEVFAAQVELAGRTGLALVVHTRDAGGVPERTVIHCFSGGPDEARGCLDRGAALSFSGIVTFKNAEPVREAAALCPLDRLLVETDAPFLAPVPHRGAPNEPAWVALVGERVASVRGVPTAVVEEATWANTERLFGLA